jgi:hypothetical protein
MHAICTTVEPGHLVDVAVPAMPALAGSAMLEDTQHALNARHTIHSSCHPVSHPHLQQPNCARAHYHEPMSPPLKPHTLTQGHSSHSQHHPLLCPTSAAASCCPRRHPPPSPRSHHPRSTCILPGLEVIILPVLHLPALDVRHQCILVPQPVAVLGLLISLRIIAVIIIILSGGCWCRRSIATP